MRRLALALASLLLAVAVAAAPAPATRHLVLISIDALRPELYLDGMHPAPTLQALRAAGSHARAVESVFPSVTYPSHASIVTGVRPARHGVAFNVTFEPTAERGRWYEEATDLGAPPLWEWARAAGLTTASVSWPSTLGARIDLLLPERDYYLRRSPLDLLAAASTPGLLARLGLAPAEETFRDVTRWDAFLADTAAAMIRQARPNLLLLHLVQLDYFQHRGGRQGPELPRALARVDAHVGAIRQALSEAGIAERAAIVVTGDHGFQDVDRSVFPNQVLAEAGLRECPQAGPGWRATVHVAGAAGAVFVNPPGDAATTARAEAALRQAAGGRFTVIGRHELDAMGAMPGAALGIEATPGVQLGGSCQRGGSRGRRLEAPASGGTHGYLPARPAMATGFLAAGRGVRSGVGLDRIRLIDVAPTAARLLGIPALPVEGRVLEEILE